MKSEGAAAGGPSLLRRAPHGARGLKFGLVLEIAVIVLVAPRTGRVD